MQFDSQKGLRQWLLHMTIAKHPLKAWLDDKGLTASSAVRMMNNSGDAITRQRLYQIFSYSCGISETLMASIYRLTDGAITPNDLVNPNLFPNLHKS